MEDFASLLLSQVQDFQPGCYYDSHGHCLEIITSPDSFYGVPVTPWLVVYRDQETEEIVGCLVSFQNL